MLTSYACGTGSFLDTATENSKDNDVLSIKAAKRKDLADALEKVAEVRAFEIKAASNKAMRKKNVSIATANDVVVNSDSSDVDETEFIGAQFTKQTVSALHADFASPTTAIIRCCVIDRGLYRISSR